MKILKETAEDIFKAEMEEAQSLVNKQMVLQKYGIVDPKLTAQEQAIIDGVFVNKEDVVVGEWSERVY